MLRKLYQGLQGRQWHNWRWLGTLVLLLLAGCGGDLAQSPSGASPTPIAFAPSPVRGGNAGNASASWRDVTDNATLGELPSLVADPANPHGAYLCTTRYDAATEMTEVFFQYTQNDGGAWHLLPVPAISGPGDCSVMIDPMDAHDLFLSIGFSLFQPPEPGAVVLRSQDGGASWSRLNQPDRNQQLSGIDGTPPIFSGTDGRLYAMTTGWNVRTLWSATHHLFTSLDGGQTWAPLDDGLLSQGRVVLTFTVAGKMVLAVVTSTAASSQGRSGQPDGGGPLELWALPAPHASWQELSTLPDTFKSTVLDVAELRLFNAASASSPPGVLYYFDGGSSTEIEMSLDGGQTWQTITYPGQVSAFFPLIVGQNQFFYGAVASSTTTQGGYDGVIWNVQAGTWQKVAPNLPLSTAISVTPGSDLALYGSWWALGISGPERVLHLFSANALA